MANQRECQHNAFCVCGQCGTILNDSHGSPGVLTQFSDEDQRDLLELMRFVRYDKHTLMKALTFLRDQVGSHGNPSLSEAGRSAQSASAIEQGLKLNPSPESSPESEET